MRQECVRVSRARVRVPSRNGPLGKRTASLDPLPLSAPIRKEDAVLPLTYGPSRALAIRRRPLSPTDPRLPDAFVGIVAFGVTLGVAVVTASAAKAAPWGTQLAVMAVAVGIVCWWCRPLTSIFVALCGWLMLNGLVVHVGGQLGWSGRHDLVRIGVLVATGFAMASARSLEVERHQLAARRGAHHA
jgi:hypothetical protein